MSPVSDLVERQFTSVLAAPVAFMRACSVAIRCIWSLFGWTFSAKLERHKATIEGLKEERDRLRAKLEEEALFRRPWHKDRLYPITLDPDTGWTSATILLLLGLLLAPLSIG
jgi:hypothetical protein